MFKSCPICNSLGCSVICHTRDEIKEYHWLERMTKDELIRRFMLLKRSLMDNFEFCQTLVDCMEKSLDEYKMEIK